MISPEWVRLMAAYNAELNRRLYDAAARLDDAARKQPRGAFWGSIHGTFCHLLWADRMWMSRFADWPKPTVALPASATLYEAFAELSDARFSADAALIAWAAAVDAAWLDGELSWYSGAMQAQMRRPKALLVAHLFNHQTHHRGQAHALLTQAGERTGDTDLFVVA